MLFAYAWATGLIEFGWYVPTGALELLSGETEMVKYKIHACARLSRDNEDWLVPGVPEAVTPEQKMQAMVRFVQIIKTPDAVRRPGVH